MQLDLILFFVLIIIVIIIITFVLYKKHDTCGSELEDSSESEPEDISGSEPEDISGSEPEDISGSEPEDISGSEPEDISGSEPVAFNSLSESQFAPVLSSITYQEIDKIPDNFKITFTINIPLQTEAERKATVTPIYKNGQDKWRTILILGNITIVTRASLTYPQVYLIYNQPEVSNSEKENMNDADLRKAASPRWRIVGTNNDAKTALTGENSFTAIIMKNVIDSKLELTNNNNENFVTEFVPSYPNLVEDPTQDNANWTNNHTGKDFIVTKYAATTPDITANVKITNLAGNRLYYPPPIIN